MHKLYNFVSTEKTTKDRKLTTASSTSFKYLSNLRSSQKMSNWDRVIIL